jgi:hypothetical protein
MSIETVISHYKERLIRKAKKVGIWENFGQEEVRVLEDKYREHQYKKDGVWRQIRKFDNWCMNYTG